MNPFTKRRLRVGVLSLVLSCLCPALILGQTSDNASANSLPANTLLLRQGGENVKIYQLKYSDPTVVKDVAGSIQGSDRLRIAVDTRTNSLIAASDNETLEKLEALISRLDQPDQTPVRQPAIPVNLVVQLISDAGADPTSVPVDPRIRAILSEAETEGLIRPINDPHSIVYSLVNINPGDQNSAGGKVATVGSGSEERVRISTEGLLGLYDEKSFRLSARIDITLRQPTTSSEEKPKTVSTQIQSETVLIKNHPVLLSVNTIQGRNFLIVVEVK